MNLEELETLWQNQTAGAASAADPARAIPQLTQRLSRRALVLRLLLGCTVVGLALEVVPLLALNSTASAVPSVSVSVALIKFACHQALYAALAVFLVRRLRQHATRVRASSESIRAALAMNRAGVEAERRDYRRAAWFALSATALMLWSAYLNQAVARDGLAAFWPRAAFVLGFVAVVAVVAWRDYRTRLEPECRRLRELAEQWSG